MLAFFRRALGSWVVLALLGLVMVAFIFTGVGSPGGLGGGSPSADSVATVDSVQVPSPEVARRVQSLYDQAHREQPDLTLPNFVAMSGGINTIVDQYLTARMLQLWGEKQGLVAGGPLVDAEIANIPAFQGVNGRFDEQRMQGVLSQQRMTLDALRSSIRGDMVRRELVVPIGAASNPSLQFATPYARLIVAKREGAVGLVPYKPQDVGQPTDAEIDAWYKGHLPRYSQPERRVIRYAPVSLDTIQVPTPSDAAIEAQYKADAAQYAATEKRTLQQVVLADEAAARALAAKVAAGTPFAAAAGTAGFDEAAITLGQQTNADFTANSSSAVADAAFAVKSGGTTAPTKSPLGWHVVHVESVESTPARSLAEVRGEILGTLLKKARTEAFAKTTAKIDDQLNDGASFDDVVKANSLNVVTTPPVTADGKAPADPGFVADPALTALLKTAFTAAPEDAPTLETVGADGQSALFSLARVDAAAPIPLAQVRDRVVRDLVMIRAANAAKAVAQGIMAKVDGGMPLAAALAEAGYQPPQPVSISQLELQSQSQRQQVPPALRVFFTLAPGKTALAAGPNGLFVVHLDRIADPAEQIVPVLAAQLRTQVGREISDEYVQQFANAARRDLTVRKNPAAIEALGRQLTGQGSAGQ